MPKAMTNSDFLFDKSFSKLFIVESVSKVSAIKSHLIELGVTNFMVFSTAGHLFEINSDAKNASEFNEELFKTKNKTVIHKKLTSDLVGYLKKTDYSISFADNDIEGEAISSDFFSISMDCGVQKGRCFRATLKEITLKAIKESLLSLSSLNQEKINTYKLRVSVDKYIGSTYKRPDDYSLIEGDTGKPVYFGTVISPVINSIKENNGVSGYITKKVGDNWFINVSLKGSQANDADMISGRLSSLTIEPQEITVSGVTQSDASLWNGTDTLMNISETLNTPLSDSSEYLQQLYTEGKITYHRSDSRRLENGSVNTLSKIASSLRFSSFSANSILEKSIGDDSLFVQDAHEAVIPTKDFFSSLNMDINDLSIKEKILFLITRNCMKASSSIKYMKENGALPESTLNEVCRQLGVDASQLTVERYSSLQHNRSVYSTNNKTSCPNGIPVPHERVGDCEYRVLSKDMYVLKIMMDLSVGRPSTHASHATKIAKQFINSSFELNKRADRSLLYCANVFPNLLDKDKLSQLRDFIYSPKNDKSLEGNFSKCVQLITEKPDEQGGSKYFERSELIY